MAEKIVPILKVEQFLELVGKNCMALEKAERTRVDTGVENTLLEQTHRYRAAKFEEKALKVLKDCDITLEEMFDKLDDYAGVTEKESDDRIANMMSRGGMGGMLKGLFN